MRTNRIGDIHPRHSSWEWLRQTQNHHSTPARPSGPGYERTSRMAGV